jgi:N-carbamoyl-L-amino-acid hydrolase
MRANLTPDMELATRVFASLAEATRDGLGVTREAYGPREQAAHDIVRAEADALGLQSAVDHAGNLMMTLPGADRAAKRIILGSHLDSVREGGNFDGAAGVVAGLAAVAGMKAAGFTPGRDIAVLAIRAEEAGAWFPTSYPGSRMALGTLPPDALSIARQDTGRSLADHMREAGFDPDAVRAGRRALSADDAAAYLELHIEQGPVLDAEEIPVGIVTGIPGSRRLRAARIVGEYNHSGATPRRYRRDAAIALAEFALGVDEAWAALEARGHHMVCTFCVMGTTEGAGFTKVAGEAAFQLDVRSVERASLDALYAEIDRLIPAIEARRGVKFELGPVGGSDACLMDPGVQDGLARAAAALGVAHRRMASGGGHDAVSFAQAGIPAGMLFVRNQNGSHNPHEAMRTEDFAAACAVVTRWAAEQAG